MKEYFNKTIKRNPVRAALMDEIEVPSLNLVVLRFSTIHVWFPILTAWYELPSISEIIETSVLQPVVKRISTLVSSKLKIQTLLIVFKVYNFRCICDFNLFSYDKKREDLIIQVIANKHYP